MKFVGSLVAHEASLADGTPLAGGVEYDLTPAERGHPYNARLIAEGQLLAVSNTEKARDEAQVVVDKNDPSPAVEIPPQTTPPDPNGGNT